MTVTTIDDLKKVFFNTTRGETPASHWTMYGGDYGITEKRITSNERLSDMDESFNFLVQQINALNHPAGVRFRVMQYPPKQNNNPTATYFVQIGATSTTPAGAPAIAGLPAGVAGGNIEGYIQERIDVALLRKENEELKEQINGPNNFWERALETVAASPQLSGLLNNALIGFISQFNPAAAAKMQAIPINGTPTGAAGADEEPDPDPQATFSNAIQAAATALGTDPVRLAVRLNQLVQADPATAKTYLG